MKRLATAMLVTLLASAAPAAAAPWETDTSYIAIQFAQLELDPGPEARETARPRAVITRVGHQLHERFGLEGRLGLRAGRDEVRSSLPGSDGDQADVRMDRLIGVYGTARFDLGGRFEAIALAGYTDARVSIADPDTAVSRSRSGPSAGIALDYAFGADYRARLELMHYVDRDDVSLQAIGIGVAFIL